MSRRRLVLTMIVCLMSGGPGWSGASASAASRAEHLLRQMEAYARRGDRVRALAAGRTALATYEDALGAEHMQTGQAAHRVAQCAIGLNDYASAAAPAERALRIARKCKDQDRTFLVAALVSAGVVAIGRASYETAQQHLEEALGLAKTGPNTYTAAAPHVLSHLASLHQHWGNYRQAEEYLLVALALREKESAKPTLAGAQALVDLARLYTNLGDYQRAEPYLARAFLMRKQLLPPNHPQIADTLDALGRLNRKLEEFTLAERCLSDSLARRERAQGRRHPSTANTLHFYATLKSDLGKTQEAYDLQKEALDILTSSRGAPPVLVQVHCHNLGWFALGLDRLEEAERLLQRSLALARQGAGQATEDEANVLASLAIVAWRKDRTSEALELATRSNRIYDRLLERTMRLGSQSQKLGFLRKIEGKTHLAFNLVVSTPSADPAAVEAAYTTMLRRKGRAADSLVDRDARAPGRSDRRALEAQNHVQRLREELSHLALSPHKRFDREESKRLWLLERDLSSYLRVLSAGRNTAVDLSALPTAAQVAGKVPEGSALIDYVLYRRRNLKLPKTARKRGPWYCAAFVLLGPGRWSVVDLGPAAPIERAVHDLRRALARPDTREYTDRAAALARLVWAPLHGALGPRRNLMIAPDGKLHLVPFAVLPDAAGDPLLTHHQMVYLNSGRELLRAPRPALVLGPPMGLGCPQYDAHVAAPAATGPAAPLHFRPLSGTKAELESLVGILPRLQAAFGSQATERLLKRVRRPSILHIATHGFFLDRPAVLPAGVRGLKRREEPAPTPNQLPPDFQIYQHPFLRCGLAFAGANHFAAGGEDGVLTALEAAGLDLLGTQLVVLSACDTGVGEAVQGEGVFGLRRAFYIAGARTLVVSLWKVHDQATQQLMTGFYRNLKNGQGKATALRNAQLSLRKQREWRHPFFWAGFIVSGDSGPCAL